MRKRLYVALLVVVLSCLAGWTGYAQGQRGSQAKQTWEYSVLSNCSGLESAGTQGWELVSVSTSPLTYNDKCYLKRAK